MSNKYLEKIALFGFSDKEKKQDSISRHYVAQNNVYANHFNDAIKDINEKFGGDKLKTPSGKKRYVENISLRMKSNNKLYSDYHPHFEEYKDAMKKHGVEVKGDHKDSMNTYIDENSKYIKSIL